MYNMGFRTEKMPDKLSFEEFKYYFNLYKSGNMNARDILIQHNLKLVVFVLHEFNGTIYDLDDLFSVGVIGLIKAIDSYDLSMNKKLSTFAYRCIKNEILMYIRGNKKYEDILSLDCPVSDEIEGDSDTFVDILVDFDKDTENDYYEMDFRNNFIKFLKNTLSERELMVILMYFGFFGNKKYIQEEISECLGLARTSVSKILTRSLNKIEKRLVFEFGDITNENCLTLLNEKLCFNGNVNIKKLVK